MLNIPLATGDTEATDEQFWNTVLLYHSRPHLVNRRLIGISQVLFLKVSFSNKSVCINELFTRSSILYELRKFDELTKDIITVDLLKNIIEPYDKNVGFENATLHDFQKCEDGTYISVRILLARQLGVENCLEIVIFDKKLKMCTFRAVAEFDRKLLVPSFPYALQLNSSYLTLCIEHFEDAENASSEWLTEHLFLKLLKWINNYNPEKEVQESLSLVSVEAYTKLYHALKNRYGKEIVEKWPERTDPLKFVYEDIAIAAYLISLWKTTHPNTKPAFVDLGCGNGLLTYILNQEGFHGEGIDVRKRKIWDFYTNTTLKVETITPSARSLFPNTDWIIGNHSDELTPWIPVIAARSSYKCNFFLLPCCAYEFNGQKYKRKNTSVSTYSEYLKYVENISTTCGFEIAVDKLRIPSTKRTCIVSFSRTHTEIATKDVDKNIADMISEDNSNINWTNDFKPRSNIEKVKNCTQLNRDYVKNVIKQICLLLLDMQDLIVKDDGGRWNKGTVLPLPRLAEAIGKENLKELKSECGGLQTLLKNHRYIFEVGRGLVKIRPPATAEATKLKYKSKLCWFYRNHPDGCLHNVKMCAYQH